MKKRLPVPIVLLAAALFLLVPLFLRVAAGHPLLPGPGSYAHIGAPGSLYDVVLIPFGAHAVLLSVLLGIAAAYAFTLIGLEDETIALALFLANPLFLTVFTSLTPIGPALVCALFALVAARRKPGYAVPLAGLAAAFSPATAGITIALLAILGERRLAAAALALAVPASLLSGFPFATPGRGFIAEFGAPFGLSALYALLALCEGVIEWAERKRRGLTAAFTLLLLAAPWSADALAAASVVSVIFASAFAVRLFRRRWSLGAARDITLLLAACLLLFLLVSHALVIVSEQPTKRIVATLAALPPDESAVLAPPELAPLVAAMTTHDVVVSHCGLRPCDDIAMLYAARRLPDAERVLDERGIRYIIVTREMREGGVWNRDEEGLLFLLERSGRFTRVAAGQEEIWRYEPRPR